MTDGDGLYDYIIRDEQRTTLSFRISILILIFQKDEMNIIIFVQGTKYTVDEEEKTKLLPTYIIIYNLPLNAKSAVTLEPHSLLSRSSTTAATDTLFVKNSCSNFIYGPYA